MVETNSAERYSDDIREGWHDFLEELPGAFIVSHNDETVAFYAVDRFATIPLYFIDRREKPPIVSRQIEELLPHLNGSAQLDKRAFVELGLMGGFRSERTPFEGISQIPPGHFLEYRNGMTRLKQYWSFATVDRPTFTGSFEEAVEELRYLIHQAVRRAVASSKQPGFHISGGMDSCAVAGVACNQNPERSYFGFAHMPPKTPDDGHYESDNVEIMDRRFSNLTIYKNLKLSTTNSEEFKLYETADNWHGLLQNKLEDPNVAKAAEWNVDTIFTGLGGDELASFGQHFQNWKLEVDNDWQAKWFNRYWSYRKWRASLKNALLSGDFSSVRAVLTPSQSNDVQDEQIWQPDLLNTGERNRRKLKIALSHYPFSMRYRRELLDRRFFTIRNEQWNLAGRQHGISYRHPLLDKDLIEFCVSLPKEIFHHPPGETRRMFRQAMADDLPAKILTPHKTPSYIHNNVSPDVMREQYRELLAQCERLKETYAGEVFQFDYLIGMLQTKLNVLESTGNTETASIRLYIFKKVIGKSLWLNRYFG